MHMEALTVLYNYIAYAKYQLQTQSWSFHSFLTYTDNWVNELIIYLSPDTSQHYV